MKLRIWSAAMLLLATMAMVWPAQPGGPTLINAAHAQQQGEVPGNTLGGRSDATMWRQIRRGMQGDVSIPNKQAGVMIQSEGDNWRAWRNGPMSYLGGMMLFGIMLALGLFFATRGRIRIDHGWSERVIERFNSLERFAHWLTAVSFIVLGLTGLNVLYGRYVVKPIIGADAFAWLTFYGKMGHNYLAFAFMLGVVLMFVLWVRQNLPTWNDVLWMLKGGGMFTPGSHPPARKFNAGQKVVFWVVIIGGFSISLSGLALLFPFEVPMFAKTFALMNQSAIWLTNIMQPIPVEIPALAETFKQIQQVGFGLPTVLTAMQEMQLTQLWHSLVGLIMICVIIGHIYIGTLGMEGAYDAMGSGMVDENWAREHHSLWVEEEERKADQRAGADD